MTCPCDEATALRAEVERLDAETAHCRAKCRIADAELAGLRERMAKALQVCADTRLCAGDLAEGVEDALRGP